MANFCTAVLKVDGYAGYNRLIQSDRAGPTIRLAYCWAHARRKLFEVARNSTAPIAEDRLKRIAELYKIEAGIWGGHQRPALPHAKTSQHRRSPGSKLGSPTTRPGYPENPPWARR